MTPAGSRHHDSAQGEGSDPATGAQAAPVATASSLLPTVAAVRAVITAAITAAITAKCASAPPGVVLNSRWTRASVGIAPGSASARPACAAWTNVSSVANPGSPL